MEATNTPTPRGTDIQCACRFERREEIDLSGRHPVQTDECGFHAEQRKRLERELHAALKRAEEAERERDKAHMEIESLKGFIGWKAKPEAEQAAERRLALLREIDHYGVLSEGMKRRIRAEISASTPAP